jgi:hypothetical protein
MAKAVEPGAKSPTATSEGAQPVKAVEPETAKPIAATTTQS